MDIDIIVRHCTIILALLMMPFSSYAQAAQIKLAWDASTSSGVAGYQISYGQTSGLYATQVDVGNRTSATVTGLSDGATYYFAAKAYDSGKTNYSGFSNEASGPAVASMPSADLRLSLGFDEGSGTVANDASGNNAQLMNGAGWGAGRVGGGVQLDGVDDIAAVSDSPSLGFSGALTVAAWAQRSTAQTGWRMVLSRQLTTTTEDQFYLAFNGSQPHFGLNTANVKQNVGAGGVAVGEWVHLAGVYDGVTMKLFVNGVEQASLAKTGVVTLSSRPVLVGGGSNSADPLMVAEAMHGVIDDVRIYSRSLTSDEIAALMAPAPATLATPQLFWYN